MAGVVERNMVNAVKEKQGPPLKYFTHGNLLQKV
jgi:hypothetical protein